MDPRLDRLKEFVTSPDFPEYLETTLEHIRKTIKEQVSLYSDDFQIVGLVGLSVHNARKANRVFASITRGKVGKDKLDEEIDDLLMYAVYTYIYYQMLKEATEGKAVGEFIRYAKYEVMKLVDIDKFLSDEQKTNLDSITKSIQEGRVKEGKPACNRYVVVNEDMPYAEQVWKLIEEGEKG